MTKLEILRAARDAFRNANAFAAAKEILRKQMIERGAGATLHDTQAHLCEDGRTVLLWAAYESDTPACASFMLARPIAEEDFEPGFYTAQLEEN
jgi:hypothetical protein